MSRTAVLVNEFGEVGVDNLLIEATEGRAVLMDAGCVCCTIRDGLSASICTLIEKSNAGGLPPIDRIVIETTGLAKPGPIMHTMMSDPAVFSQVRLDSVLTTVDALNGMATLSGYSEALAQAALADRIVLTKTDLATVPAIDSLLARLAGLNPSAVLVQAGEQMDLDVLLHAGPYNPVKRRTDLDAWINEDKVTLSAHDPYENATNSGHIDRIRTFYLDIGHQHTWEQVASWLDGLASTFGERLLRLKGIVRITDTEWPIVIHGVQGVFHPPGVLPSGSDVRGVSSRIVFITDDLDPDLIVRATSIALGSANAMVLPKHKHMHQIECD